LYFNQPNLQKIKQKRTPVPSSRTHLNNVPDVITANPTTNQPDVYLLAQTAARGVQNFDSLKDKNS
jgi:hypothetical protein